MAIFKLYTRKYLAIGRSNRPQLLLTINGIGKSHIFDLL